ncbi:MAG TPA: VOC family protein [Vicinamibacterales bacterium]|nr:VOC family protein [Vicinamibacterales bacterium]
MITHVKFVGIPTRNQDAALAFYTEKLGFKVATDQPMGAQRWIELRLGSSDTGVVLFTPEGHEDRIGTFFNGSLATDNVERTYEELKARGVEFTAPPQKQPWGTFAKFKDVDGNEFVLSSR